MVATAASRCVSGAPRAAASPLGGVAGVCCGDCSPPLRSHFLMQSRSRENARAESQVPCPEWVPRTRASNDADTWVVLSN